MHHHPHGMYAIYIYISVWIVSESLQNVLKIIAQIGAGGSSITQEVCRNTDSQAPLC